MQYSSFGHSRDIYTMFPPVTLIQRSFEMMAAWLMFAGSAAFLRWVQVCCTRRFLPVQAMWFFCEVMDMLLLADAIMRANVTFPNSKKVCRTHRFLLVVLIQSLFSNSAGQCKVPALEQGVSYTQVSAGSEHTLFLRSDGRVVARGQNKYGQSSVPSLKSWSELLGCRPRRVDYISDLRAPAPPL